MNLNGLRLLEMGDDDTGKVGEDSSAISIFFSWGLLAPGAWLVAQRSSLDTGTLPSFHLVSKSEMQINCRLRFQRINFHNTQIELYSENLSMESVVSLLEMSTWASHRLTSFRLRCRTRRSSLAPRKAWQVDVWRKIRSRPPRPVKSKLLIWKPLSLK